MVMLSPTPSCTKGCLPPSGTSSLAEPWGCGVSAALNAHSPTAAADEIAAIAASPRQVRQRSRIDTQILLHVSKGGPGPRIDSNRAPRNPILLSQLGLADWRTSPDCDRSFHKRHH